MDEIVNDFLIESRENLDRLDQDLVKLEGAPSSKELLASIFRTIHTIKGSCGFLGFGHLEKVAHSGESLLSKLRDGELTLDAEITSGLLGMVDAVRTMLANIQETEHDGDNNYDSLTAHLSDLQGKAVAIPAASANSAIAEPGSSEVPAVLETSSTPLTASAGTCGAPPNNAPDRSKIGGVLIERGIIQPQDLAKALEAQELGRQKIGEILVAQTPASSEEVEATQKATPARTSDSAAETIRVGVNLLDRLMNLVGELVLARNQLLQFSNNTQDAGFQAVSQRMNLIATELQEEVMKTRMQPIGNVWNKFPRTVRDLALSCGKDVRLEMEGQDTELDRTIIEAIKDPLTHLVRNCVDHGIEPPEARKQARKPAAGVVKLRAFHEGGQVNIEITDDGAGLNAERIREKAIERGLISAQQAARMSDRDVFNMIFLPGFSTAEKVTNVSGRGVGMDVVKTNVEKIGGTVDVQSTPAKGTTVKIKIPLTLAIIPALMITSCGERYAIPQVSLLELVRVEAEQRGKGIEMVHGAPVHRLRGRLLPLVTSSASCASRAYRRVLR
jgi:two-component system, chemotaxis family, sensor kinase CheA